MTRSRRLKENSSTHPLLNDEELLTAGAMPVSADIHQVTFVIRTDGHFEFAERITPVRSATSVFHKETGSISAGEIAAINASLNSVHESHSKLHADIPLEEIDPFEYESRDRRTITSWRGSERKTCSNWADNLYYNYNTPTSRLEVFVEAFDSLWRQLFAIPRFVHVMQSDGAPTFPLVSSGSSNRKRE